MERPRSRFESPRTAQRGLQALFQGSPTAHNSAGGFPISSRRGEKSSSGGIGAGSFVQGCHRGSSRVEQTGLLQPSFYSPKEDRRLQAGHRSKQAQQIPHHSTFQDGNHEIPVQSNSDRRLGYLLGPLGCLSPRSYSSGPPSLSPLLSRGQSLRIPLSSVRSLNSSLVVHQDCYDTRCSSSQERHESSYLSGRLVTSKPGEKITEFAARRPDLTYTALWISHQFQEVLAGTQDFVFIGVRFCTDLGIMLPPDKRIIDILDRTSSMKVATSVTARQFLSFLGLLNSAADQIPLGRLHMRPLQLFLLTQWKPVSRDLLHKIVLQHDLLQEVWNFWTDRSRLQEGVSLEQKTPDFTIETDASVQGWGAHLQGDQISGSWTSVQRLQHINVLEMLAMEEALFHWLPRFRGHVVQVLTDNSTVMYYIIKQGGTKSLSLCTLAWRILRWCKNNNISLVVKHIPGKRNVIADSLSRQHKLPGTEWTLLQSVVDHICKLSQHPMLDLFATSLNKRLPVYVSPLPDPLAMAMDALSISWDHLLAYAFPPTALLTPVLKKVQDSVNCQLVLVAPAWANQSWYPTLLHLSVDLPIQLPSQYNLLWHPVGRVFHANPALFNLHAWRVSSNTSKVADFRRKLPIESHPLNVNLPEESTIPDGRCSCLGVINGRRIHSIRLFQS